MRGPCAPHHPLSRNDSGKNIVFIAINEQMKEDPDHPFHENDMPDTEWNSKEKAVLKTAIDRARKRAEEEALKAFRSYRVSKVDDLWKLEQQIRARRKDHDDLYLHYESMEERLSRWIRRGWLKHSEISGLEETRLKRIQKKV